MLLLTSPLPAFPRMIINENAFNHRPCYAMSLAEITTLHTNRHLAYVFISKAILTQNEGFDKIWINRCNDPGDSFRPGNPCRRWLVEG